VTGISRRSALVAAFGSLASAASVGAWLVSGWVQDTVPAGSRRIRTSFGSVQVLASRWEAGEQPATAARSGAAQTTWSDQVVVLVEVRNDSRALVRVAAEQFRLRAGDGGPRVDFLRAEPPSGTVAPGRVLHLLLTFAVSPGFASFGLEYREAGVEEPLVAVSARFEPHRV
jgi:hypothetical protein